MYDYDLFVCRIPYDADVQNSQGKKNVPFVARIADSNGVAAAHICSCACRALNHIEMTIGSSVPLATHAMHYHFSLNDIILS